MQNINKGFGLLFEMGCGKTLTAIAIAGAGYQMGKVERLLIVAPTSVVAVWPKELQEYAKFKYTCKTLLGEKKQRIKQIDDLLKFPFKALKVAVINYESTWRPEILEKLKEFDADMVIADESQRIKTYDAAQSNSYWEGEFGATAEDGSPNIPKCSSMDGKTGVDLDTGEVKTCENCPLNQYADDGSGKPCKNIRRLYLLISGKPGVYLLSVPPTSIKDVNKQLAKIMGIQKIPYTKMVVRLKLETAANRSGIKYSKVVIEKAGILPKEIWPTTSAMRKELKEKYRDVAITSDDYNQGSSSAPVDKEGFMDVDGAITEDVPFNQ